jgi:mRNA-degrading endonuclease RelE of RelBE toxin-antitoxin system
MPRPARFKLIFAPETVEHLDAVEPRFFRLLQEAMDEQLTHTPTRQTRNRKPLEQPAPFGATWELRLGPNNRLRVFYQVDAAAGTVQVLAIGIKVRNRLYVGREEYLL